VLVTNTKQITANVKQNALSLIIGLLQVSAAALETIESCPGICYGKDKKYHETCLQVDATGIVQNLHTLLMQHTGFTWAWGHLMTQGFCNYKIISAMTHPTLWDLLVLLAWAKNNQQMRKVWHYLGQFLWPKVLFLCSKILSQYALLRSKLPIEQVPLLKTKKGRSRKVPWMNKLVFLKNEKN
jgi:hypothetical protein